VAHENAARHGVADRLDLRLGHLTAGIQRRVPLIVANLPYVPAGEIAGLEPEVAAFEPRLALDGGPGGTSLIAELIATLPALLLPGGSALLEFGYGQADELSVLARQVLPTSSVSVEPDAAGIDRYLVIDLAGDADRYHGQAIREADPAAATVFAPSPDRSAAGLSPSGGEAIPGIPSPPEGEKLIPLGEGWGDGGPPDAQAGC
jgi:hypothetical protein